MSNLDPDDAPTRHGGEEDRTVPSFGEDATVPTGKSSPRGGDADPTVSGAPAEERTVAAGEQAPKAGPAAAARFASGSQDLIGKTLGGCRIDRLLGRGAMGAVYQARQLKLDRDVAIKVIRPEMITDERMLKRFEVEARIVGRFNSPHVVMVHDVGFDLEVHYLVMELVVGTNLREHVKLLAGGRLPAGEALSLIRQACKGLDEARRLGVVHRDIKPDNLMLTDQGVLKIADFGIAKPVQGDFNMTMTSELIGTPLYMSPEQCQGGADVDFRSDMYSLGATFFYLLTGEPPVRASSVYELIQTKTKLENLCLWKALPGLDENNPLSRVIERMTANNREDRYGSYDELLNDLVLVEAGETIRVKAKRIKQAIAAADARDEKGAKTTPSGGRKGLWIAALVAVLVGGGGGYAWYANQQPRPVPVGPGPVVVDAATAQRTLDGLRARLREQGPDARLHEDVMRAALTQALEGQRESLSRDIELGQALRKRLAELQPPRELELPFDELRAYLQRVDRESKLDAGAGDDLLAWRAKAVAAARAETQLADIAGRRLVSAFAEWGRNRRKWGGEAAGLAALSTALQRIEDGRQAALDSLPPLRATLDRDLPQKELAAARQSLAESPEPVVPEVDVSAELDAVEQALAVDGPQAALTTRLEQLRPTRQDQVQRRNDLLTELDGARGVRTQAEDTRTRLFPTAVPPFDDIEEYYRRLDIALKPLGEPLPLWAGNLRTELRSEAQLSDAVVAACSGLLQQLEAAGKRGADADTLVRMADGLKAAIDRAVELFPTVRDRLAEGVPPQRITGALDAANRAAARRSFQDDLDEARRVLANVSSLDSFRTNEADLGSRAQRLAADAQQLDDGSGSLQAALRGFAETYGRWRDAAADFDAAAASFGKGALGACENAVKARGGKVEGRQEFGDLGDLAMRCRRAFTTLDETLAIDPVVKELRAVAEAADTFRGLPAAVSECIRGWQRGVEELRSAAAGMVPIAKGRTRDPAANVAAFFLAPTECTCEQFERFVAEVRQAAGEGSSAEQFERVAARLAGTGMDARRLGALFTRNARGGSLPMEHVSWNEAKAFAAWYGHVLPRKEEWLLAALGDQRKHDNPWGGDRRSMKPEDVNLSGRLLPADNGGLCWRQQDGIRLHHLAGNVAEWLDAPADDRRAPTAGGRYSEPRDAVWRAAAGEFGSVDKQDTSISGVGFRVALRPREFAGLTWPVD